jgi:bacterioferritin-associated ferredoxin
MIVCHCAVVRDRDVALALAAGARGLAQVCRATGAAGTCGGCVFSIRQLVHQHQPRAVVVTEPERAAS